MELSVDQMNIVFKGMQLAGDYVRKHAGLRMAVRLEFVEKPGTPREMMRVICEAIEEDEARYSDGTRQRPSVELRALAATLMRQHYTTLTQAEIGKLFNGEKPYDHTTIGNLVRTGEELLQGGDSQFTTKYKRAERAVELWLKD